MQAETDEEARKRNLYNKMQEEDEKRRERKVNGKVELDKWIKQRQTQIEGHRKVNAEQEASYHDSVVQQRNGPNPWERVVNNCEMNSSQYVGGADVSRMRQAMLTRKSDITKQGSAKNMI